MNVAKWCAKLSRTYSHFIPHDMETKLNENEVKEVARMQMKIDTYESFISTVNAMVVTKKTDINYLLFDGTELTDEMNHIWRFIKQKIKEDEGKKDSKAT